MKPLVNFYDGEPWFDNPPLVIANPKRRKKTMRKRRTRRGRKNSPRRRARRNYYSAGMLANRPRRRRRARTNTRRRARRNVYMPMLNRKRGRRRARRNPGLLGGRSMSILGFQMPPMDAVLFTAAGLIGPGLVSTQILSFIPASWKTNADGTPNQLTMWATKIASVLIPAFLIRRFINVRAGNLFLIGGSAGLAMDALKTFAPGLIPGLNGIGSQPLLGAYFQQPRAVSNFPRQARVPAMIADAPDRLSPQGRF
jgi:hypothetical protein